MSYEDIDAANDRISELEREVAGLEELLESKTQAIDELEESAQVRLESLYNAECEVRSLQLMIKQLAYALPPKYSCYPGTKLVYYPRTCEYAEDICSMYLKYYGEHPKPKLSIGRTSNV